MVPLSSIGRAGAVAGSDGAAASSGTKRAAGPSFGKSLEFVIGASQAERQRNALGPGGPTANLRWQPVGSGAHGDTGGTQSPAPTSPHANDRLVAATASSRGDSAGTSVQPMLLELQPVETQQVGIQQKSQPFTANAPARSADTSAASGMATQSLQGTTEPQSRKSDNYGYGTPGGYQLDTVPSTLDPGSMAFLLAWLGGSDGQSVQQQQQSYLETYRQRYPDGAPGVKSYITAATNYLTGTS